MAVYGGPDIVTSGLVLHLDAGNSKSYPGTENTWYDLSGNNNGTLINDVGYSSNNGGSLIFDGNNDIVNTSCVCSNIYTFSAWFKTNVVSNGYRNIISVPTPNYSLILLDTGTPNLGFWTTDGLGGVSLSTPTIITNNWYNVVLTREGNNIAQGYKSYLNSVPYGTANTGNWSTTSNLSIGGRTDAGQYFNGNISQIQIYSRALKESEIQQNYNALKGRYNL